MKLGWVVGAAGIVLLAFGCTFVSDWSLEGLPCDEADLCVEGFSCLESRCVANRSLVVGEVCSEASQCIEGSVCLEGLCRVPCTRLWAADETCEGDTFCAAFRDSAGSPVGGCVVSQCLRDTDCGAADAVCVTMRADVGACLMGCRPALGGVGYADDCPQVPEEQLCQPVGASGAQRLVCVPTSLTAAQFGDACSPVAAPCRRGLACIDGRCVPYCDVSRHNTCGGRSERCCAVHSIDGPYHVCRPQSCL